jgi:hypothetical protein
VPSNDFKEANKLLLVYLLRVNADGTTSAVEKEEIEDKVFNFKIRICRDV